jgi:8-oxo-dGTP diphosphatase
MAKIILATQKSLQELQKAASQLIKKKKKSKGMKSLSKSKFGIGWAVFRDPATGMYLICQRSPTSNNAGQWGWPGGGVDEGETHAVAVRREVSEEIGVTISLRDLKPIIGDDDTNTTWFEVFQKIKPKLTEEVSAYKWVYPYDLDEYPLHKSVRHYFRALANHTGKKPQA